MSSERGGGGGRPSGDSVLSGRLFGFFSNSSSSKSSKSLDAPRLPRQGSGAIEVQLQPDAFARECAIQLAAFADLSDDKDRASVAPRLCNFVSRGLRYHLAHLEACKSACAVTVQLCAGGQAVAQHVLSSGLLLATLMCCKVSFYR